MQMLTQLFTEHPTTAIVTTAVLLLAMVLPFARRRFPRVFLLLVAAPLSVATTPFLFWARNIKALASKPGRSKPGRRPGADELGGSYLTRRLLAAMQGLMVLGGILILSTGVLTGLRSSGILGHDNSRTALLEAELPFLTNTLKETTKEIEALDREWEEALGRRLTEHRAQHNAPIDKLETDNAGIGLLLLEDPCTRDIFIDFTNSPAEVGSAEDILLTLEAFLPLSPLMDESKALLLRYFENSRTLEGLTAAVVAPPEPPARAIYQPEYDRLRLLAVELPAAIERVEAGLKIQEEGRNFDVAGFLSGIYPPVIIFCAFIWTVGFLIDILCAIIGPSATRPESKGGRAPQIDANGTLIWAD